MMISHGFSMQSNIVVELLKAAISIVFLFIARCLTTADLNLQRLGAALRLQELPSFKAQSPKFRRNFNRGFLPTIVFVLLLTIRSYRHERIERALEVPILGSARFEQHLNLYYPPIGCQFHPEVPDYNAPPRIRPRTPLFIPFTRNNTMLRQAVLSYIASGWPRNDIVIIDNSGTMDSNPLNALSPQNPFYLDYSLFRHRYGVSILQTPTLLNFAQLQNFMLRQALARNWPYYFWSHMDVAILSAEDLEPYQPFYHRVLDILYRSGLSVSAVTAPEDRLPDDEELEQTEPSDLRRGMAGGVGGRFKALTNHGPPRSERKKHHHKRARGGEQKWAVKFFDFDNLVLVNVEAWRAIGSWDTFIPYYNTDCDFYARVALAGYQRHEVAAGYIFDVAEAVREPESRFFPGSTQKERDRWGIGPEGREPAGGKLKSWRWQWLKSDLSEMQERKNNNEIGRNTWQDIEDDGEAQRLRNARIRNEPWTYDPKAFQAAWWATADAGRAMYVKKWATLECDLVALGNRTNKDMWKGEYLREDGSEEDIKWRADMEFWTGVLAEGPIR
jgi:hypothetical protein